MQEVQLQSIAERIIRARMRVPAILFLEMHKPLASLVRESFAISAPLVSLLFGGEATATMQDLFSDTASVEKLITYLEQPYGN